MFKSQHSFSTGIFVAENGTILFCGCHQFSEHNTVIQPYNNILGNYETGEEDCEHFDYELPSKVFKHLFKFISLCSSEKNSVTNEFEILIRCLEVPPEGEPELVNIGPMTITKPAQSTLLRRQIEEEGRRKGQQMLCRNFDSRDNWDNIKPHCHKIMEHIEGIMVLPEFLLRNRYYSTHAFFKDFEPISTLYNVCSVHRGMFSTSGDVQYIGGCSVHRGDTMSTSGGHHEYIGGCSVHWRDTMSTSGDVQYIGEIP